MTNNSIIARILGTDKTSPAEEIRRGIEQLEARHKAIDTRLAEIQRASPVNGGPGPERRSVLHTGTPDQLVELDREAERLTAERDQQLPHQRAELDKRLEKAEAEEAAERLPATIKRLPAALDKHDKALAALKAARVELDELVSRITTDRRKAGNDAPGVDRATAQRVAEFRGAGTEPARRDQYNTVRAQIFETLGAGPTERREPGYNPYGAKSDKSEQAGPDELRRQPEQSIWNRPEPGTSRRTLSDT